MTVFNNEFFIAVGIAAALSLMLFVVMIVALGWTHYPKGIQWKKMWKEWKHGKNR